MVFVAIMVVCCIVGLFETLRQERTLRAYRETVIRLERITGPLMSCGCRAVEMAPPSWTDGEHLLCRVGRVNVDLTPEYLAWKKGKELPHAVDRDQPGGLPVVARMYHGNRGLTLADAKAYEALADAKTAPMAERKDE